MSREKIVQMLDERIFDGSNHQIFWILLDGNHAGMIRIFDLDDVDDGCPLFDLRIAKEYHGKGLGSLAVTWLTDYLFQTYAQLLRIEGNTRVDNLAMRAVFTKCLFVKEAHKRKAWRTSSNELLDSIHYGILREDWENKKITPLAWEK